MEQPRRRPVEQSRPHRWLGRQVIMPARLGGRRPGIGPGRPWWPPHYFFRRWSWALGQYRPSASPRMEGVGGSCCSIRPRGSRPYRVGRPVGTCRHWPELISWSTGTCSTAGPVGSSGRYRGGTAWVGLEVLLIFHSLEFPQNPKRKNPDKYM